jgi:hypothetical protein
LPLRGGTPAYKLACKVRNQNKEVTVSLRGADCDRVPLTADTTRFAVVFDVKKFALRTRVLVAVPGPETVAGENEAVTPDGKPLTASAIEEVNPFAMATVTCI